MPLQQRPQIMRKFLIAIVYMRCKLKFVYFLGQLLMYAQAANKQHVDSLIQATMSSKQAVYLFYFALICIMHMIKYACDLCGVYLKSVQIS